MRISARILLPALIVGAWLLPSASAHALVFPVSNTNNAGGGSLREAITFSEAFPGVDTILISPSVTGTINLQTALPTLVDDVTITGPGANKLTVRRANGAPQFGIFTTAASSLSEISDLTITDGNVTSGGGVSNAGNLTLRRVAVSDNTANTGGGVFNTGTLSVDRSTISGNTSADGAGGIASTGGLTLRNSTIADNTVNAASAAAGGLFFGAPTTIENSTIASNTGPGIANVFGVAGVLTAQSSIVADPEGGGVNCAIGFISSVVSQGYNLESTNTCGFNHATDLRNTNPTLEPLTDNGGPTETMQPAAGSPAIDRGKAAAGMTTDQRGSQRPFDVANFPNAPGGDGADIGAYERRVTFVTNANNAGSGSLRAAIANTNANPGFERILFAIPPEGGDTINLLSTLTITDGVEIEGPGLAALKVTPDPSVDDVDFRVFDVAAGISRISGLWLSRNIDIPGPVFGGVVLNDARLTLERVLITEGLATTGGGVANTGELTIESSTLTNNYAPLGGAISNVGGELTVRNSTISDNHSFDAGDPSLYDRSTGGVYNNVGEATIENSTIAANEAEIGPAANLMAIESGAVTRVKSSIVADPRGLFAGNCAGHFGGEIVSQGFNLEDSAGCFGAPTDLQHTDPELGPLVNNGGGTLTMEPEPTSPALDRGLANGLTADQRGEPRPNDLPGFPNAAGGDGTDIGALELGGALVVTNTNDAGAGSLRSALQAVQALDDRKIIFAPAVTGTISLQTALPPLTRDALVLGPGADVLAVRRAAVAGQFRVFTVSAGTVSAITGLTISNGSANEGGAINNAGDLFLARVAVTGSSADNGGGVFSSDFLEVVDSTISGNSAALTGGGGISSMGTLGVFNSTITGNSVAGVGGNRAGGLWAREGGLVVNSTIAGNTYASPGTGGAANLAGNDPTLGATTLLGTLIADPLGGSRNCPVNMHLVSNGYNLESANTCGLSQPTDQVNKDPELVPLADNGGPTKTMALFADSPAVDKGKAYPTVSRDQRGSQRPFDFPIPNAAGGDGSDVGAFEQSPEDLRRLTVATAGAGQGTVTSAPAGIDCGATCEADFHRGAQVVLTAVASPGSEKAVWSGCDSVTPVINTCVLTMNDEKFVSATFELGPQELTVTNTNDSGPGSLRQALTDTGLNGATIDSIDFAPGVTGTINLQTALPTAENTEISGPGPEQLTVRRAVADPFRIFTVNSGTSKIAGLTIADGSESAGGGVLNTGTLTLERVWLRDNASTFGAIANGGPLTVRDSTISGSTGGGIHSSTGEVTLERVLITGNSASQCCAGGVHSSVPLTVRNSTITGNTAPGGADTAGGIYTGGPTTIENSTIAGNTMVNAASAANLTVSNAALTVKSTIIAKPLGGALNCKTVGTGTVTSQGYNVESANACALNQPTDQARIDPKLLPLASNGGPTQTMALFLDSPALDKGKAATGMTTDQRGQARPVDRPGVPSATGGDGSDVGAFELAGGDIHQRTVVNTNDSGAGSLRQAVTDASANASGVDTIGFAPGGTGTINLQSALPPVDNIDISGPGAEQLIVRRDAAGDFRIFEVNSGPGRIAGLTAANGSTGSGGAILNTGNLTLEHVALVDNTASFGAIANGGPLTVSDSTISGNDADGIHTSFGRVTLVRVTLSDNGGAGMVSGTTSTIRASTIAGNAGPGVVNSGQATLDRVLIANNEGAASGGGGGVNSSGPLTVRNSTITGNTAPTNGTYGSGGIFTSAPTTIENSTIAANTMVNATAAANVIAYNAPLTVKSTLIATPLGGVANCKQDGTGTLTSQGYSLESADTCGFNQATDLINTNARLRGLADNGGPTKTMALFAGSPAVDKGTAAGHSQIDQRGSQRPVDRPGVPNAAGGDGSDVGAFELTDADVRHLTVARTGTGSGTVTSSPAAINCGTACEADFNHGIDVILTPASGVNTLPAVWSGCDSVDGSNQCLVDMIAAKSVTARFDVDDPCAEPAAILGTAGSETITGTAGDDTICARGGADTIRSGAGDDLVYGEGGRDFVLGESGDDSLDGGAGRDTFARGGGTGADLISGDVGVDVVSYSDRTTAVTAQINGMPTSGGAEDVGASGNLDTISTSVEGLVGGAAGDTLRGNAAANTLVGGPGADRMLGLNGNDRLRANDGVKDLRVDCDGGTAPGAGDEVIKDADDPQTGCESVVDE